VRIDDFCVLSGHINIGSFVHIACHVVMTATRELITIGDFSTLSYGVKVFSASDDFVGPYYSNPTVDASLRNVTHQSVFIGEKCAVGAGSVMLPGSYLEEGVSVGANSLVKDLCEAWSVYAGIPATLLRKRKNY
jgi:galactoside O-acetyltransferase